MDFPSPEMPKLAYILVSGNLNVSPTDVISAKKLAIARKRKNDEERKKILQEFPELAGKIFNFQNLRSVSTQGI